VESGKSGGGLSFGYEIIPVPDGQPRGEREINLFEAAIVQRIFRDFVAGISPKAIAKKLNAEGTPGPRGTAWSPSTIHGHAGRGTGILNNELYIGRLVWNRQRYVKDPDTGKRLARINPTEAWITTAVPHLRIIDDDLWQALKARQASTRHAIKASIVGARRPKFLFSGLTRCESCGGGFVLSGHDLLTCFNARSRGTCTNRRSIKRRELEGRVLLAMRKRFFEPGAFAAFCEAFTAEMTLQRREHLAHMTGVRQELVLIDRRLNEILKAFSEGLRSESWKADLLNLDARKAALTIALSEPPLPALHPHMAEVFRQRATTLVAALEHDAQRDAARQALRGFLDKIVIPPGEEPLQVVGNLGSMLAAAQGRSKAAGYVGCGGGTCTHADRLLSVTC